MKQLSVGIHRRLRKGLEDNRSPLPKEGTKLRHAYDLLYEARGNFTTLPYKGSEMGGIKAQLENFYGFNIRAIHQGAGVGSGQRGKWVTLYCLTGEYGSMGRYIDYMEKRASGELK